MITYTGRDAAMTGHAMRRRVLCVLTVAAGITAVLTVPAESAARAGVVGRGPSSNQVVLAWNTAMIDALRPTLGGPVSARLGAIVSAAVYDAVNGITGRYIRYHETAQPPHGASPVAAAAGAAYEALRQLVPDPQGTFAALLARTVPDPTRPSAARGLRWGIRVADDIVNWRASDGIDAILPPYTPSPDPGRWQPTPPGFVGPLLRQFATMIPFALTRPDQFLPLPPPALTSTRYAADFAETEAYGRLDSTVRTSYDTETALLIASDSPLDFWDTVANTLISSRGLNLTDAARLLAQTNLAMGDAGIAVWNAKNFYDTWRPITAIQHADTDGNPATTADPTWQPLLDTPPFQEYPSAHSGLSTAAATVLAAHFGNTTSFQLSSPTLPGVTHTFTRFSDAVAEVTNARIYAGFHFRFSCQAAATLGSQVAHYILTTQMRPADE